MVPAISPLAFGERADALDSQPRVSEPGRASVAVKRVLIVHNYYRQSGGEEVVMENESDLLRRNGCEVRLATVSNFAIAGPWQELKAAWSLPHSRSGRAWMAREIAAFGPDIVHVHNVFPLLTPAVYTACNEAGVPVVQTLHNYRALCANALLIRDGRVCEACVGASPYRAVIHRCYRDSRLASWAAARAIAVNHRRNTWQTRVDRYIALTEFARSRFMAGGLPADKITVKPNFVADRRAASIDEAPRRGALYVGRVAYEKGIETMARAWSSVDVPLRVVGDGPMLTWLKQIAPPNVTVLGRRSPDEVAAEMARAAFLVMPSEWYEGFPMTLVEAFCQGLPVVCSRLGALRDLVSDRATGLHFSAGDASDLADKARWAGDHPAEMAEMGRRARRVYESAYTPEANYPLLMGAYEHAISNAAAAAGG